MKRKGFTLIELLGVFTLLGLILLISIPTITGTLKKQKENTHEKFLNDLYLATEAYIQSNAHDNFDNSGDRRVVLLEDLVKNKYIKSTLINPSTNEKIDLKHAIEVTIKPDGTYQFEYISRDVTVGNYVKENLIFHYDAYTSPVQDGDNYYLQDLSGNNHKALMIGFDSPTTSMKNHVLTFDGVNDYIETDIKQSSLTTDLTISTVVDVTDNSNYRGIWGPHHSNGSMIMQGFTAQCEGDDIGVGLYTSTGGFGIGGLKTHMLNKKVELTVTVQLNNKMTVYVNGEEFKSIAITGGSMKPDGDNTFWIGKSYPDNNRYMQGYMYNFMIYGRALTAEEVKQNYQENAIRY